jgi:iron complex outermembrane recepter protein
VNDNRAVSIGFTYRFNKGKLKAGSSKKSSGASDEENRVKSGS